MIFSPQKQKFIDSATEMFGAGSVITNKQIKEASAAVGIPRESNVGSNDSSKLVIINLSCSLKLHQL